MIISSVTAVDSWRLSLKLLKLAVTVINTRITPTIKIFSDQQLKTLIFFHNVKLWANSEHKWFRWAIDCVLVCYVKRFSVLFDLFYIYLFVRFRVTFRFTLYVWNQIFHCQTQTIRLVLYFIINSTIVANVKIHLQKLSYEKKKLLEI